MLINNGCRQCVLALEEYSTKRLAKSRRRRKYLNESNDDDSNNDECQSLSPTHNDSNINTLTNVHEDHTVLGRLLKCKPCQNVIESRRHKVGSFCFFSFFSRLRILKYSYIFACFQKNPKPNWEDSEANLYWKYKAVEHYNKTQEADKVQEKLDNLSNR